MIGNHIDSREPFTRPGSDVPEYDNSERVAMNLGKRFSVPVDQDLEVSIPVPDVLGADSNISGVHQERRLPSSNS